MARLSLMTLIVTAAVLGFASSSEAQAEAPTAASGPGVIVILTTTATDAAALPLRRSTWAILGIGGGAALATHPADDSVNERLARGDDFFAAGHWLGMGAIQIGGAATVYTSAAS
jgi:hypothetical protein